MQPEEMSKEQLIERVKDSERHLKYAHKRLDEAEANLDYNNRQSGRNTRYRALEQAVYYEAHVMNQQEPDGFKKRVELFQRYMDTGSFDAEQ